MGNNGYKEMIRKLFVLFILLYVISGYSQARIEPSIGYVYPAGGQRGSSIQITVGGQNLRGVSDVYISGNGIVIKKFVHVPPLNGMQRRALLKKIKEVRDKRRGISVAPSSDQSQSETAITFPPHPLLENLENLTPKELEKVVELFIRPFTRLQRKTSIQEMVVIDMEILPDASPGDRELRLLTPSGFTNPLCFQVGTIPEILEEEPNEPIIEGLPVYNPPVLFNGQIMPGDVDRFRFHARKGQKLVIEVQARHLIPYMADAVPGWFQATLSLYDSTGKEIAYADDYYFNPDPVIFFNVPEDGNYTVEIKDAIYRGREDFVYRLSVSEKPFIISIFPSGGKEGERTTASVYGVNLPEKQITLDTSPGALIRKAFLFNKDGQSNPVFYAVDNLPEYTEKEFNNSIMSAERVKVPQTINGRIGTHGDVDIFKIECSAEFELVAEVYARRLGSPLDALLKIMDERGNILVWNDDTPDKSFGLNTHHADSYIYYKIPRKGTYFIQISDTQGNGGDEYTYRLRLSTPRPDFVLFITPSVIKIPAGSSVPFDIHIIRKDNFNGAIELSLKDVPEGFILNGGLIPPGKNFIRVTITAPLRTYSTHFPLNIEGKAVIEGNTVVHSAIPAENMMQAFGLMHLVPTETSFIVPLKPNYYRAPPMTLINNTPLKIPESGSVQIDVKIPDRMSSEEFILELKEPPDGIFIEGVEVKRGILSFRIKTDSNKVKKGLADNLIVEVFTNSPVGPPDESGKRKKQKVSRGFLPAISFEII